MFHRSLRSCLFRFERHLRRMECSTNIAIEENPSYKSSENKQDSLIKEGKAEIFQPSSVFYNPVQEFNRDLTISVISEFAKDHFHWIHEKQTRKKNTKEQADETRDIGDSGVQVNEVLNLKAGQVYSNGLRILEGLAASGLRSIRFAKEIPGVKEVIANDFDQGAVEYIKRNITHNNVETLVSSSMGDAAMVMYMNKEFSKRFDVIDLDPYGSPAQFLDAIVQAIRDGGLLCVTCTDLAVLCGVAGETCHAKYGSYSVKGEFCHEEALRIILRSIESHANRYSRYIEPLLSLSADFYIRVFVKVHTGAKAVKNSVTKLSMVYACGGCGSYKLQPISTCVPTKGGNKKYMPAQAPTIDGRCSQCDSHYRLCGPLWSAPIHDTSFISRVLDRVEFEGAALTTQARIRGVLSMMTEELPDVPLYYKSDEVISNIGGNQTPKYEILRSAILNAGYRVSGSHAMRNAIKTDAPPDVLYDIARCWEKQHPRKNPANKGSISELVLSKECKLQADFTLHPLANPKSRSEKLLRFQENPLPDWGPKARATKAKSEDLRERRERGLEKAKEKKEKRQATVDLKQYECKRFKTGECDLGEDCCYSHEDCDQHKDQTASDKTPHE